MESKWRKAKKALGLSLCIHVAADPGDTSLSDVLSTDASAATASSLVAEVEVTGSGQVSRPWSKPFKKTCAICLGSMKPGQGHALFTAECSHTFHFNCITSNVKHGNYICPVCRAKWNEIPFQGPSPSELPHGRTRVNPVNWPPHDDAIMTILRRNSPRPEFSPNRPRNVFQTPEPIIFNDDEPLDVSSETSFDPSQRCIQTVEIKTYTEFSAVEKWTSEHNFTILINLKAPASSGAQIPTTSESSRAPIDLVTVLDISGSMSGTKLALLKRALSFVIQNLNSSDRLSVVTFSTFAHRLFHLRRMSESGRQQALLAVNSLSCHGGTNISEGLRKGAKVIQERREKNPVCSMILLSDGQDTLPTFPGHSPSSQQNSYRYRPSRLSSSSPIPVHAFGFGDDHDSVSMHSISEHSGGTFSYIEAESVIQDAFAQCIGGLLSVVVQEMEVEMEAVHPGVHINSIKSGSYASKVSENRLTGLIRVGDLYAEEERDFLVSVHVPPAGDDTNLLRVKCVHKDPVSKEIVRSQNSEVMIERPGVTVERKVSVEVDRQRNRLQAAESMAEAKAAADRGSLQEAATILENRRRILLESEAGRAGDHLCLSLDAELTEILDRMSSQHQYDVSGRAYVLAGLSSHSWQRATARGDSTHSTSLVQAYQTPSMVDMLQRSQTLGPPPRRSVSQQMQQARSFNLRS